MLEKVPNLNNACMRYSFEAFCDAFLRSNFSRQVIEDIKEERQEWKQREQVNVIISIVMAIFLWITDSRVVRLFIKPLAYAYGGIALGFILEFY